MIRHSKKIKFVPYLEKLGKHILGEYNKKSDKEKLDYILEKFDNYRKKKDERFDNTEMYHNRTIERLEEKIANLETELKIKTLTLDNIENISIRIIEAIK